MRMFGVFKGATMFEAWIWRFYIRVPYWKYLRVGCRPHVGFDWGGDE